MPKAPGGTINSNYILSCVYGQSMFPALRHADKILIKKVPAADVKVRDILVYKNNKHDITHRVVKIVCTPGGKVFYTKGDFNRVTEKITEERILGKVVGVYRKDRLKMLSFENSAQYYFLLRIFCSAKESAKKVIETMLSWAFIRRFVKLFLPLKVNYLFIEDVGKEAAFKSFYNFYPFAGEQYIPLCGFLAECKNKPIGKLWVLNNKDGQLILYGPYVKLLYRARGIGSGLIRKAVEYLKSKGMRNYVVAFLAGGRPLASCFRKSGFPLQTEAPDAQFLKISSGDSGS